MSTSGVPPLDSTEINNWRVQVLEVALRITTLLLPVLMVVIIVTRREGRYDAWVAAFAVQIALIMAIRFMPQLGFRVRAGVFVGMLQVIGITAIVSSGLLPGSGMAALMSVTLCAIFFGSPVTWAVLLITPLTYVIVGAMVAHGGHHLRLQDADPMVMGHWVRAAAVIAALSIMLGLAIEYVARQVEQGYRSAMASASATRTAYDQLGMLHRRLELAKEEERSALARELHDEMGQTLTVLKLHMQLIFRGAGVPSATQQSELIGLVDRLIFEVRKISLDLRPTMLDEMGLEPALAAFVDGQAGRGGLTMTLEVEGISERLSPEIEHACFRLVQEAVTNTQRHAKAKHVIIRVRREHDQVRLDVRDDGSGFSEREAAAKTTRGHLGLVGMRERVRLLGGTMVVGQAMPGSAHPGTAVQVTLPAVPPRAP